MESKGRGASGLNQPMGKATRFGILESKTKMLITLQLCQPVSSASPFFPQWSQASLILKVTLQSNLGKDGKFWLMFGRSGKV